ncbi:MerR family transcriptional regulator [Cellulomonas oligotrophica]|uniref:DNA-binding transcriptional MerR regulator n=1 Tax=Cellulomonas oligotrophica TaxID=931536 RepID=A0A7Y9K091_9CELL|nr:MerR family transcriptional regulator [Cellulomonas oligotrophica]NYD87035.1 DNA-binding transcriptional MerR regulator [Cellulomonas oligotrophica]GIG32179.1 HTH-type transcriptional activator TipA [Cellulomonas oligotrophica]
MDDQAAGGAVVSWTVGQVAAAAGTSVRALHHYDRIGLVRPSGRSPGGHRLYDAADLARLRRVLFYRELELPLPEIARLLADTDAAHHLRRQHAMLRARLERTRALLTAIEDELDALRSGISLTAEQQLEIFGTETFAARLARATVPGRGETRPTGTDDASGPDERLARRTAAYTEEDWRQIKTDADGAVGAFAAALDAGDPPDGPRALAAAEQHRRHLERWFFDCDHARHVQVADGYLAEPGAAPQWDAVAPGFAQYVHAAITANARHAPDRGT